MKRCPKCHERFDDAVRTCPVDATGLMSVISGGRDSDPLIGRVLGDRYRVTSVVHRGVTSDVYLAHHVMLGTRLAVKILKSKWADDEEVLERFRRGTMVGARCSSAHLLGALDAGALPDGRLFLVTEFLDGRSMRELLDELVVLPLSRAIPLFLQICSALEAVHDRDLVLRNLAPENVFLVDRESDADFVYVIDFFWAGFNATGAEIGPEGRVVGTPPYAPPEQIRGAEEIDGRSDIYAIGVMLYEALTGTPPFGALPRTEAMLRTLVQEPAPPSSLSPLVTPPVEDVISRAMAKNRYARFRTCRELAGALRQLPGADGSPG